MAQRGDDREETRNERKNALLSFHLELFSAPLHLCENRLFCGFPLLRFSASLRLREDRFPPTVQEGFRRAKAGYVQTPRTGDPSWSVDC